MLALMSQVLWVLGDVDGAVTRMAAALERADAVRHAHTHAYAWYYASILHALRGEPAIADSDEVARAFRFDGARDSDIKSPRAWSLAGW
jgi:hypothetical protein